MIFDINEGFNYYDSLRELDFNSIREEACDFDDPILASGWVGVNIDATFNRLMEATAVAELHAVQETGTMAIYEVDMSGAKDRIKAWFESAKKMIKKIAQYIKGFFVKVFKMLESVFATGLKISRDNYEIFNNMDSDVMDRIHFSGYEYTLDVWTNVDRTIVEPANKQSIIDLVTNKSTPEGMMNESRKNFVPNHTAPIASDSIMKDLIFKKLRGDASGPKTLNAGDVYGSTPTKVLDIMAGKKADMAGAKMDYKEAQQFINDAIERINNLQKEAVKENNDDSKANEANKDKNKKENKNIMKGASIYVNYLKMILKTQNAAHSEHIKAIRGAANQARSVAQAMIRKGTKIKDLGKSAEERYNESVYFNDDYNNDSYSEYMNIEF